MKIINKFHKELAFIIFDKSISIRSEEILEVDNSVAVELLKNPWIDKVKIPIVKIPFLKTVEKLKVEKPEIKQVNKNISKVEISKIKKTRQNYVNSYR